MGGTYFLSASERKEIIKKNQERGFVWMSLIDRFVKPGKTNFGKRTKYSVYVDGKKFRVKKEKEC